MSLGPTVPPPVGGGQRTERIRRGKEGEVVTDQSRTVVLFFPTLLRFGTETRSVPYTSESTLSLDSVNTRTPPRTTLLRFPKEKRKENGKLSVRFLQCKDELISRVWSDINCFIFSLSYFTHLKTIPGSTGYSYRSLKFHYVRFNPYELVYLLGPGSFVSINRLVRFQKTFDVGFSKCFLGVFNVLIRRGWGEKSYVEKCGTY